MSANLLNGGWLPALLFYRFRYDLVIDNNLGVQGRSVIGGICTDTDRISIIEYEGITVTLQVGAHELGHNLGALHDNDTLTCSDLDNFIMATDLEFSSNVGNLKFFSPCSIEAFINTTDQLNQNNDNCMVNDSALYNATEYQTFLGMSPGQRYTRDQQCQAITGEAGSYYEGNIGQTCTVLQCYRPSTSLLINFEGRALDETTCGNKMWCENFQCVANDNAPIVTLDEQCQTTTGESGAYYAGGQTGLSDVCSLLICFIPSMNNIGGSQDQTLDFTSCGNQMWCVNHVCVSDASAPEITDCQFGDAFKFTNTHTCPQYLAENPNACTDVSTFSEKCCETCASPSSSSEAVEPSSSAATGQSSSEAVATPDPTTGGMAPTTTGDGGGGGEQTTTGGGVSPSSTEAAQQSSDDGTRQQTTGGNVQPSSTVDTVQPSEEPATTEEPATVSDTQMKFRITFAASECDNELWKTNLQATLKSSLVHSKRSARGVMLESCTTGSSIVVYLVENGATVTDEERANTAAEIIDAIDNNQLTIGGTPYTLQGNPVMLIVSDTGTVTEVPIEAGCSYHEELNLCASGASCALNENNFPYCKDDDNDSVLIIVLSVCGAVLAAILLALIIYVLIRYKNSILPQEHRHKRRYIRRMGRRWTRPQQQAQVYPQYQQIDPYQQRLWNYQAPPTKYSPAYAHPVYMTHSSIPAKMMQPQYY